MANQKKRRARKVRQNPSRVTPPKANSRRRQSRGTAAGKVAPAGERGSSRSRSATTAATSLRVPRAEVGAAVQAAISFQNASQVVAVAVDAAKLEFDVRWA